MADTGGAVVLAAPAGSSDARFRNQTEIYCLRIVRRIGSGPLSNCCELLMTAQDKRDRAMRLREIAATRSGMLAHDIIQQAKRLEAAADEQERAERRS